MGKNEQQSDESLWDATGIYIELRPALLRYLSWRLNNVSDAHDLAQEAYLRLSRVPKPELIEKPKAYLYRITANLASEFLIKKASRAEATYPESLDDIDAVQDSTSNSEELQASMIHLERTLEALPPLYRAVLLMRRRDGYSHSEIAEKLDISVHTVHRYLTRAVARCRQAWSE